MKRFSVIDVVRQLRSPLVRLQRSLTLTDSVERLRRDHAVLRRKLAQLNGASTAGADELRTSCVTLLRRLHAHDACEERLAVRTSALLGRMTSEQLDRLAIEHDTVRESLRTIVRALASVVGDVPRELRSLLGEALAGLSSQMDQQERHLFPWLDTYLSATSSDRGDGVEGRQDITELMTVNYILRCYPRTRAVFDQLYVDPSAEGTDCLDEVAWRRGVAASSLIDRLSRIAQPIDPEPSARETTIGVAMASARHEDDE